MQPILTLPGNTAVCSRYEFDRQCLTRQGTERKPAYGVACTEVWGGNTIADDLVEVPGLQGWVHSKPLEPATTGGDVYYLSVCDRGRLSRVVLADVKGHGETAGAIAATLRKLLRKYMNTIDQSALMREINEAFGNEDDGSVQYATAAVLGYYCKTGELVFANAGHPPALWYHASQKAWDWLQERTPHALGTFAGLPLGLILGTDYEQTVVRLAKGDLLILYTDGVTECTNEAGNELGHEGLVELVRNLPVEPSVATGQALLAAVEAFRGSEPCLDDQSVVVLQRV
jgi:serine phosphatase RsbU (regulator of sigma subunit)